MNEMENILSAFLPKVKAGVHLVTGGYELEQSNWNTFFSNQF